MFICTNCSATSPKWSWKCLSCSSWNTLIEKKEIKGSKIHSVEAATLVKISHDEWRKQKRDAPWYYKSSSSELDTVLGDGLSRGSLVLLSWEPWIWKSTLALQMSEWYAHASIPVLYVSWEEHLEQIFARAKRLWVSSDNISFLTESDFDIVFSTIEKSDAEIIIIDSLSVLSSSSIEGSPGSVSQIRVMTEMCMHLAKKMQKSIVLIGHITKDGSISGPKSLEHLVDVVLFLEGVRTENYRILRALKNRFGSTDAVGLFRMEQGGLVDLPNPWLEFIDTNLRNSTSGSALSFAMEWNRPILIEIEALSTYTKFWYPKRSSRWIHGWKLDLLLAVISKFTDIKLESYDVYLNIARWLSLSDPGIDLASIAAIISSKKWLSLGGIIWLGEVSLTWRIKNVYMLERRLIEAAKLWLEWVIIPKSFEGNVPKWLSVKRIGEVSEIEWIMVLLDK